MSKEKTELHWLCDTAVPIIIVDVTAEKLSMSKQKAKQLMKNGAVWLESGASTRRVRKHTTAIKPGETLHVYFDPDLQLQAITPPTLIHEAGDYSVWFKPAGMLCQGSKWGDHLTITRLIEKAVDYQKPVNLMHRLDRATSGLMLFTHNKAASKHFTQLFETSGIDKFYHAKIKGQIAAGTIFDSPIDGKSAKTEVLHCENNSASGGSCLFIQLHTGRKHQIRRHLAEAGHPLVGDRLYGNVSGEDKDLQLQAVKLVFRPPDLKETIEVNLPQHLLLNG